MTAWLTVLLGVAVVALAAAVVWLVARTARPTVPVPGAGDLQHVDQKLSTFRQECTDQVRKMLEGFWTQVQGQVQTTDKSVSEKLAEANRTYAEVKEELGALKEATEQVEAVGRDVAGLQELLRAPKIRGGIGEFLLGDLLAQILPGGGDFYALQYEFSGGDRVDAVIRLSGRLVSVDAKFPLDQFRRMGQAATEDERARCRRELLRDVRQHIDAIAQKYIRPTEGTFDFALMYIPAEGVYYEALLRDDGLSESGVLQHAMRRRVIPVSPSNFYAYLQVILLGLRGLQVEQRAKDILANLMRLQQELGMVHEAFDVAGKQLRFTVTNFEKAERHLGRFEGRLDAIETGPTSPTALPGPDAVVSHEA